MLQKESVSHLPPPHPDSLLEMLSPSFVHLPEALVDIIDDLDNIGDTETSVIILLCSAGDLVCLAEFT